MNGVIDRCPTGIVGFDKLCDGGFVRNSDNLIVGGPGSGKSTFLLQFLWNGANQFGENGLYCSFEPDIVDTMNDAMSHGWDFSRLSEEGRIKFMRFAPQTSVDELKKELTRIVSRNDIRRVCFDPVSVLALSVSEVGKIRQTIFELSSLMKRLKVTTVFADESFEGDLNWVNGNEWTKTDILRFLSDSVTTFYESPIAGAGDRAVRITKMRRTAHERSAVGMTIGDDGVEVFERIKPVEKVETVPAQSAVPVNPAPAPQNVAPKPAVAPQNNSTQNSPPVNPNVQQRSLPAAPSPSA
jgi:circadian clock protein KaiC